MGKGTKVSKLAAKESPARGKGSRPGPGADPMLLYVGERVKEARLKLKLTQAQLAEKAGCAAGTIFLVENARQNMTIKSLAELATALDITVGDLFPRSEAPAELPRAKHISEAAGEALGRARLALRQLEALMAELGSAEAPRD
jgi:transcriptional regulator with XRE-family HTH domain